MSDDHPGEQRFSDDAWEASSRADAEGSSEKGRPARRPWRHVGRRRSTSRGAEADSTRLLILLVEDDDETRCAFRAELERHGYEVREAWDGRSGIAAARLYRPSLIVMDVSMPIMDGWDATRALKKDPATAAIPIVALTAHVPRPEAGATRTTGPDRSTRAMLDVVRNLVGPARPRA